MIYTITFSPSIDYIIKVENFNEGEINRTSAEMYTIGGKGINVSVVLKNLGIKNTCLGFVAGFTGETIINDLNKCGCSCDFIKLENGFSRINVKIKSEKESDINGQGPEIPVSSLQELFKKIEMIKPNDMLVLAGNIPNTLPKNMYEIILEKTRDRNIKVIVDATGELLLNALKHKPFLIKPNDSELGELFNVKIKTKEEILMYGKKLQELGAENVMISMGENGALLITANETFECGAPKQQMKNTTGAGDSMVAGFIAGYLERSDFNYALKMGVAAGSATAFSDDLATNDEVAILLKQLGY